MNPDAPRDDEPAEDAPLGDMPTGDHPAEDDFHPSAETDGTGAQDVSAEVQSKVNRLEQAVWHAPRGKGTRVAAIAILVLMAASLLGLIVLAVISFTS